MTKSYAFSFRMISQFLLVICVASIMSCKTTKETSKPPQQNQSVITPPPPVKKAEVETKKDIVTQSVKRRFVLIMPFVLEQNFAEVIDGSHEPEISPNSLSALNFYEGAQIALDSLKPEKIEIQFNTYDVPSDSAAVVRMFTNANVKDADLVFATLPGNLSAVAASVAKTHNIHLVLTQASSPDILKEKPNVALALASTKTQCRQMVDFMLDEYVDANIILVYRTVKREDELADVFRQEIIKQKGASDFQEFNATKTEYPELAQLISKTKRNLVFLISSDEAFVSPVLALLEEQNLFGIKVSGLPTWLTFESIDFMTFNNLQVHLFDNNFIQTDLPGRMKFRKTFINRFQMDPLPSAYNGFDMVYQLGLSMKSNFQGMEKLIEESFRDYPQSYNFEHTVPDGLENTSISVLKISDYKMERLNK